MVHRFIEDFVFGTSGSAGRRTFTQYVFGANIRRSSVSIYFKVQIGLFAGILASTSSTTTNRSPRPSTVSACSSSASAT
jgi:hypothetical protein